MPSTILSTEDTADNKTDQSLPTRILYSSWGTQRINSIVRKIQNRLADNTKELSREGGWETQGWWGIFKEGLTESMVFEESSERSEGVSHRDIGKKNSPGRDNSRLKDPWGRNVPRVLEKQQVSVA